MWCWWTLLFHNATHNRNEGGSQSVKQSNTIIDSGVLAEHTAEKTKKNEKTNKSSVDIIRTLHHWTEKISTNRDWDQQDLNTYYLTLVANSAYTNY